ncbi:MAG: hypothetical protein HKN26_04365 [Acidimicrobiales bacterium]|nr:hypothetical protein [Acidimicrobiales bacterium]
MAALLVIVAVWIADAGARADGSEGDPGSNVFVESRSGPNGSMVLVTGKDGSTVDLGASMPAWLRACTWRTVSAAEAAAAATAGTGESAPPADLSTDAMAEPWAIVFCGPGPEAIARQSGVALNGVLGAWALGDRPPQLVVDWIVARTVAELEIPVLPVASAPAGTASAPMITGLPTWFWVDEAVWQPVQVNAPEVFGVVVTVTAEPVGLRVSNQSAWRPCGAGGQPFRPGQPDHVSRCTLSYEHSSARAPQAAAARIRWRVSYACSAHCGRAALADVVVATTGAVVVGEVQVLSAGSATPG